MPSNFSNNFIQCIKCNNSNGDFYRLENTQHAGYCSNCLIQVIRQKFTSCLGRNRIFKNSLVKDVLLIYIPNQLESIFLLNFTHLAICGQDDHRKLRINVKVLLLLDDEEKYNKQILQNIVKENQSEWRWYATHLSNIFGKTKVLPLEDVLNGNTNDQLFTEENLAKFSLLLANCQSKCIRNELLRLIRTKFILQIANSLNCPIVFLPENADQLAENVLNAICFGRGSTISDISAILDTRFLESPNFASIQLVRPLHDISLNELEAMKRLNFNSDKKIFEDTKIVETNQNGGVCVQQLTGQFINQLRQSGFPATISTILSVSAKVESERDGTICTLCFGRYQPKIESLQRICCSPCNSLINEMKEEGKTLLINAILNC